MKPWPSPASHPIRQQCSAELRDPMASPFGQCLRHRPLAPALSKPGSLTRTSEGHGIYQVRRRGRQAPELPLPSQLHPKVPLFPQSLLPEPSSFLGTRQWEEQAEAREGKLGMRGCWALIPQLAGQRPQLEAWRKTGAAGQDGRERRGRGTEEKVTRVLSGRVRRQRPWDMQMHGYCRHKEASAQFPNSSA